MRGGKPLPPRNPAARGGNQSPDRPAQSRALVPVDRRLPVKSVRMHVKATRVLWKVTLRSLIVIAIVGAAAFAGLHLRLAHSPISMSFVVPPIERAVNKNLPGLHFDIGGAVLRRSESGLGIEFRLADVKLLDDNNNPVAESPYASANVSPRALFSGRFATDQINLIGPRLYLHYSDQRGFALSFTDPRDSKGDLENPRRAPAQSSGRGAQPATDTNARISRQPAQTAQAGVVRQARGQAVSLTKAMTDLFSKIRQGQTAYLTSFGIQEAVVYFDQGQQISSWQVPTARIDLRHRGPDSAIEGQVSVRAPTEDFQFGFRAEQDRQSGELDLTVNVEDLVPRAFRSNFPEMRVPAMWDMPVSLTAQMTLARNGDILSGKIRASLKEGKFYAPWDEKHPAVIDYGYLDASYSRQEGLIQLAESELSWGGSRLKLSGVLQRQRETGLWAFLFGADEIVLGAPQFGLPDIPLDRMEAQGRLDPKRGSVTLDRFLVQAAEAHIVLAGTITQGRRSPAVKLSGQLSPMPIAFFKLIWPKFVANGAWDWIGSRVPAGRIADGTVNIDIPADLLAQIETGTASLPSDAVDFRLALRDLKVHYVEDLPPMQIAQGTARVAGQRFFFNVPEAQVKAPSGELLNFSDGQFIVGDLRPHIPEGEIHFKSDATARGVLSLLDHPSLGYISSLNMPLPDVEANVASTFSIGMPLYKDLKFAQMEMNGRSRVENVQARNLPGGMTVNGGSVNFNVSESAVEAQGELKMNGVPTFVAWRRNLDQPPHQQPPMTIRAVIDESVRKTLGLDIDHVVRGPAAAELTIDFQAEGPPKLDFKFDLTKSDLLVSSLGWRKPPGRRAVLSCVLHPRETGGFEIRNINLQGDDDLSVRGRLRLDDQYQPVAFNFPEVGLSAQTQLDINGQIGTNNVWHVKMTGSSFDGRRFFKSLFSAGKLVEDQPQVPEEAPGVDADIEVDRVIGFFDTTLRNVKMTAKRRNNRLHALDMHGLLNGRRPLAARIQSENNGQRQLLAEATDAGAAFRLVGFYPSGRGGEVSLSVKLDGDGQNQTSGILYARNFSISNDQVVEEVLSGSNKKRQEQRQPAPNQLQFNRMRVPFSVGDGRFVLREASINGPVLGATLRGAIDFKREQIDLAGTYVPLYGINGALGSFPIIGDLLVSRSGEGLFGITFAVKGPTSNPNVLVNPMSMVAPGFLRQLFEFNQTGSGAGQNSGSVAPPSATR